MPFCGNCGAEINEKQVVCLKCGCAVPGPRGDNNISNDLKNGTRNKWVAVILAFFLGGLGAHKFYLGQIGSGILYLLFCWTFIPALIAFIEGIIYLAMSDQAFAAKYN